MLDGTLRGASIGASNVTWERQLRRGAGGEERWLPVATRYDLVELSLVDNPSNPDALGVTFVRDAAPDITLLDRIESDEEAAEAEREQATAEGTPPRARPRRRERPHLVCSCATGSTAPPPQPPTLWEGVLPETGRAPAATEATVRRLLGPFSTNAEGAPDMGVPERAEEPPTSALGATPEGNARERLHAAARGILLGCGCALCATALAAFGEGGDDGGMGERLSERGNMAGAVALREAALVRVLGAGLRASATRLEQVDAGLRGLRASVEATLDGVTRAVGGLSGRIEALEAQPLPGGPAARAVEKTSPLSMPSAARAAGAPGTSSAAEQYRVLESLAGRLSDPQAQIAVAAEMIRLQREG